MWDKEREYKNSKYNPKSCQLVKNQISCQQDLSLNLGARNKNAKFGIYPGEKGRFVGTF